MALEISKDLIAKLAELAFVGLRSGLQKKPEVIFEGLTAYAPNNENVLLGIAILDISMGKSHKAIRDLEHGVLRVNPNNELAKSQLGIALYATGMHGRAEGLLKEIATTGKDSIAINVAKEFLEVHFSTHSNP